MKKSLHTKILLLLAAALLLATACRIQQPAQRSEPGKTTLRQLFSKKPPAALTEIHFIDAGQGDAILIATPKTTMLVDGGPANDSVSSYLRKTGIKSLDIIIATHPHADHIGGLIPVLETMPIGKIMDPGVVHTTVTYRRYLETIDRLNIPYSIIRKGEVMHLDRNVTATILHPSAPSDSLLNDASVVLRLDIGTISLLLTGDIERASEEELLKEPESLKADIVKVPHHGSSTSLHPPFLNAVNPSTAIIMCGLYNPYGNPHRQTISLLESRNIDTYRTDHHGTVVVSTNGKSFTIKKSTEEPTLPRTIDINSATAEELLRIVHIGPARAAQIIELRPFENLDDLRRVEGIGAARLADIKRQGVAVVRQEP